MKLFYLTEHTSCYNYFKFIEEGFRYYKFDTGLNHEEKLTKDCILFVVKGSLCISYRGHEMLVREGKMIFFCRDSLFNTYSLEPCEVVAAKTAAKAKPETEAETKPAKRTRKAKAPKE